jgi:hypothetical protein
VFSPAPRVNNLAIAADANKSENSEDQPSGDAHSALAQPALDNYGTTNQKTSAEIQLVEDSESENNSQ